MQLASPENIISMRDTRVELICWLDKEDSMWHQRSCLNWFQAGDRNTSYFHSKASNRHQKNCIEGLFDEDGIWQEDDRAVEGVVLKYYPDLFKSSCPSDFAELLEAIVPKVSTDLNERLTGDFQGIEVHKALKQMYPLKSPGSNGMLPYSFSTFGFLLGVWLLKLFWISLILVLFHQNLMKLILF